MRLRILTLNVWNTEGDPGRLRAINREIRRLAPDVISFQELVQTAEVRMLDTLLDGLDMQGTHQADMQNEAPPFSAITELDARHRRDLPTVIAGDFNANPDAASIRYLTGRQSLGGRSVLYHDAWAIAGEGPGYTWTVDNPKASAVVDQIVKQPGHRSRFDYVFVGSWDAHPKAHARVLDAKLAFDQPIDGIWASDHFGVIVDLEIGRA